MVSMLTLTDWLNHESILNQENLSYMRTNSDDTSWLFQCFIGTPGAFYHWRMAHPVYLRNWRTNIRFVLSKVPRCFKSLNGEIGKDATYVCIVAFPIWVKTKENALLGSLCTDVPPPSEKIGRREKRRVSSPNFFWGRGDVCTQAILLVVLETNQKALLIIS